MGSSESGLYNLGSPPDLAAATYTHSTYSGVQSLLTSYWTLERFLRKLKTTLRKVMVMVVRRRSCALSVWSRGEVREGIRGPQCSGRAGLKKAGKAAL